MQSWKYWAMDNTDLTNATPEMALILAAGLGSRLRPQTKTPKPLTRVLGLTLAERVVCTLLDVGVRRFLVTLEFDRDHGPGDVAQLRGFKPLVPAPSTRALERD